MIQFTVLLILHRLWSMFINVNFHEKKNEKKMGIKAAFDALFNSINSITKADESSL